MDDGSRVWLDKLAGPRNYSQWKYDLQNLLGEKDLICHIDGSCPEPVVAAEEAKQAGSSKENPVKEWRMKDRKAMGILSRSLTSEYHAMIRDCKSAKEIWDRIKAEFESTTESSITDAWISLISVTFDSEDRVATFVSKLNCAVEKMAIHKKVVDEGLKKGLLMKALPPSFTIFRETYAGLQQAEQLDKISFSKLCTMAKEAETRILDQSRDNSRLSALKSSRATGAGSQDQSRSTTRLSALDPSDSKSKSSGCFECGGPHFKRECPKLSKGNSGSSNRNKNKFKKKDTSQGGESLLATETASQFCLAAGIGRRGWFLDSGASKHMTKHREWFSSYKDLSRNPVSIIIGDDKVMHAVGIGDVACDAYNGESWHRITLQNVLHIPDFGEANLVSMGQILDRDMDVNVTKRNVVVHKSGQTVALGTRRHGQLFQMKIRNEGPVDQDSSQQESGFVSLQTWHERFAHADPKKIKALEGTGVVDGLKIDGKEDFVCHGCSLGKMTQQPFKSKTYRRECKAGQRLHSDLLQFEVPSLGGNHYVLVIVDEATGYKDTSFMKHKSQTTDLLVAFMKAAERVTGNKCVSLRTDNGGEYVNGKLLQFMTDTGITHETSAPGVHQQNGMAERANRTLAEHAACLIHQRSLPKGLWAEAVRHACITFNRMPTRKDMSTTPHEAWHKQKPDVSRLRVFGCEAYGLVLPEKRRGKKLAPKSIKGIFVGYVDSLHQYKLYHADAGTFKTYTPTET